MGLTQKQAERFQQMAQNPDAVQAAMTKAREAGDVVSQAQIISEIQQVARAKDIQRQSERNDLNIDKNSCQCSGFPTPASKTKSARENKTDYQVAQKAGVSEDTIRKVENWYFGNFALS